MTEISPERFYLWKQDPVTVAFMANLIKARDEKLKEMLDPNVIRADNGRLLQHEWLGGLDVIEQILAISYSDICVINGNEENVDVDII